jgi:hypothetical protein
MFARAAAYWQKPATESTNAHSSRSDMDETNEMLYELFSAFNAYGAGQRGTEVMDGRTFAKFAKDCCLVDRYLTRIEVDLIFARVLLRRQRTITFKLFLEAVRQIAVKKRMKFKDLVEFCSEIGGPSSNHVTKTASKQTRMHDDVSSYTGTASHLERPKTGVAPASAYRAGHTEREEAAAVTARENLSRTMRSAKHAAVDGQGLTDRATWLSQGYSVNHGAAAYKEGSTGEATMYQATSFLTESSKTHNKRGGAMGVDKRYQDKSKMHSRSSDVGGMFQSSLGHKFGGHGADTALPLYHPSNSGMETGYAVVSLDTIHSTHSYTIHCTDTLKLHGAHFSGTGASQRCQGTG